MSFEIKQVFEPKLRFDKSDSSAVNSNVYWGLRNFGPYDKLTKEIRIGIICPRDKEAKVLGLINDLNNGTQIFPGGMKTFFRCKLKVIDTYLINSQLLSEYEDISKLFIEKQNLSNISVVLIYIPYTEKNIINTVYYRCKAIFSTHGYATQMLTEKTFNNLKWSYLNIATALFSKAGNVPWVLQNDFKETDMILGIALSNLVGRMEAKLSKERYVGFVNVFDNYGKWMFLQGTGELYKKNDKESQLKVLLKNSVDKFIFDKKYAPKKISIHYFKRWGKKEKKFVRDYLSGLLDENYHLTFVSIDDSHIYRLYDLSTQDGSLPRGQYISLSERNILLSTTGQTTLSKLRLGTPKILKILYETDNDKITDKHIVNEVFSLTRLNWASISPLIRKPMSLDYANKLAYLTAAISKQEWDDLTDSKINNLLSKKPWFI